MIHPETHFTDEKAGLLRATTYQRLRRHWQFINELVLFEIHDLVRYGVHIYGSERVPCFLQATSLYHPDTVERSLKHEGSGTEPGLKDSEGNWDLRPHASRIQRIDTTTLEIWHAILETPGIPVGRTRMVYTVNQSTAAVLSKLSQAPRIGSLGLQFSRGWDESIDRKKGFFDAEWGVPKSWDDVILQGPHLHVSTPLYKTPNPTMLHNQDWTATDFEALAPDAIPATSYKPRGDQGRYNTAYTHWEQTIPGKQVAARSFYRVAWRMMAANTGERTLITSLIPPGAAHIHGISSIGLPDSPLAVLASAAACMSSLVADTALRATPKATIQLGTILRLPFADESKLRNELRLRALRLNSLTSAYADLWAECFKDAFLADSWTGGPDYKQRRALGDVGREWTPDTPLRVAADRRQALVEIDALVALSLGITADELCTIYRTQFPVLVGYDRNVYIYDANGRLVPNKVLSNWRIKGDRMSADERTSVHSGSGIAYEYELPYVSLNREVDLRVAYSTFEARVASRNSNSA